MHQIVENRYNAIKPTLGLLFVVILFFSISCKNHSTTTLSAMPVAANIPQEINFPSLFNLYAPFNRFLNRTPQEVKSNFYFKAQTNRKIVALTFDDGPQPATKSLINYLKQEGIPASFFLVAKNITEQNLTQYKDSLFTLGLHSYAHSDFRKFSAKRIDADFDACEKIITAHHLNVPYYRPPFGVINKAVADNCERYHFKGVLWSIDSKDWKKFTRTTFLNNIQKGLCPGSIILMHDKVRVSDLEALNNLLKQQGYSVVSLQEILQYKNELPTG